jgi:hypothetical protein
MSYNYTFSRLLYHLTPVIINNRKACHVNPMICDCWHKEAWENYSKILACWLVMPVYSVICNLTNQILLKLYSDELFVFHVHLHPYPFLLILYTGYKRLNHKDMTRYDIVFIFQLSFFRQVTICVLRFPKDKLCDKSLQKGLFKRSVHAIRWEIEEK